jgi:2-polyprenyl-3-methyl-5-hydroxy-6-metoxy-1,4-benzoquinol methylase
MKKNTRAIILSNADKRLKDPVEDRYIKNRELKAGKIGSVLSDYFKKTSLDKATVLDIGCSIGAISQCLSKSAGKVVGIDIDSEAIEYAKKRWAGIANLEFYLTDGSDIRFADNSFDIIICNGVYEHVSAPKALVNQIHRLLKPGGICYFSAMNKLTILEPHYNIPFLSILPKKMADLVMVITCKGRHYDVSAYTYRKMKALFEGFRAEDITLNVISNPKKYSVPELAGMNSLGINIITAITRLFYYFLPTYLWIIKKDDK